MKYKHLKSVAHNFGHSFTSDMNYVEDDFVMSHLARAAIRTGFTEMWADFRNDTSGPSELTDGPVAVSLAWHRPSLDRLIESQQGDPERVVAATMRISLDVARRSAHPSQPEIWEFPFKCVVELIDDRGITHRGLVEDWWRLYERARPQR